MDENTTPVQFIKVTEDTVLSFLDEARDRVIIAKPAYFKNEIEKLLQLAKAELECEVYVDTSENSIRYGFGEQPALETINQNLDLLTVQSANYIRMAILIVDHKVMVYSPVALAWEKIPEEIEFPNGFIGGASLTTSLLQQIRGESINIPIEGLNIEIQACPVSQKAPEEIQSEIHETLSKLKENPPVDPAELRKTTFYRHRYKLLKRTIYGVNIREKSLSLRPFNKMLSSTNQRLKSSWRILTKDDVENLVDIKKFLSAVYRIENKYTFDAGRFGTLIEKKNIQSLENCITNEINILVEKLMESDPTDEKQAEDNEENSLANLLQKSRKALIEHLFSQALVEKDCWNKLFKNDKSLYRQLKNEKVPEKKAVEQAIETFVDDTLNFPKAEELMEKIHVEFDYYDISDELLAKKEFIKQVEKFDLQIRQYKEGYQVQQKLFENSVKPT